MSLHSHPPPWQSIQEMQANWPKLLAKWIPIQALGQTEFFLPPSNPLWKCIRKLPGEIREERRPKPSDGEGRRKDMHSWWGLMKRMPINIYCLLCLLLAATSKEIWFLEAQKYELGRPSDGVGGLVYVHACGHIQIHTYICVHILCSVPFLTWLGPGDICIFNSEVWDRGITYNRT